MLKRVLIGLLGLVFVASVGSIALAAGRGSGKTEVKAGASAEVRSEVQKLYTLRQQEKSLREQIRATYKSLQDTLKARSGAQRKALALQIKQGLTQIKEAARAGTKGVAPWKSAYEQMKAAHQKRDKAGALAALQGMETALRAQVGAEQQILAQIQALQAAVK